LGSKESRLALLAVGSAEAINSVPSVRLGLSSGFYEIFSGVLRLQLNVAYTP
jgi:hypothetical protein